MTIFIEPITRPHYFVNGNGDVLRTIQGAYGHWTPGIPGIDDPNANRDEMKIILDQRRKHRNMAMCTWISEPSASGATFWHDITAVTNQMRPRPDPADPTRSTLAHVDDKFFFDEIDCETAYKIVRMTKEEKKRHGIIR